MSDGNNFGDATPLADPSLLYADLHQLKSTNDPRAYAKLWLDIQQKALGCNVCQAVVVLGSEGGTQLAPVAVWPEGTMGTPGLSAVIESAIETREAQIQETTATFRGNAQLRNSIACPLLVDGKICGAVAVDVERCSDDSARQVLAQLEWGLVWLEGLIRRKKYTTSDRLVTVLNLVATSLHSERFQAAATAVVTELAGALQCERVSIGFLQGNHSRVQALSHSASFGKKTNLIRDIGAAMDEANDQQATLLFPPVGDGPLQVTRFHKALHSNHGEHSICTVPFTRDGRILGAITLEMPEGETFDSATISLCEHAASLLGPVLEGRRLDDRWLFRKALDSFADNVKKVFGPRHAWHKLAAVATVVLVMFFGFAKGDYRVSADATLEGIVQRAIAVPMSGFVSEANVRAGDEVKAGDILFTLDDRDLRLERLKWTSQKSQYSREHSQAIAGRNRVQANILAAQIEQASAQVALIEDQLARLSVTAPFDSFVVSGDLSQSLGAPVERGDILFEVAPLNQYRVILKVDERDVGELRPGATGQLALTGLPGESLAITVDKVTPVSTAEEGRNYFTVEALLTGEVLPTLRPGMQGIGKVTVDQRKLIWLWTHKITEWWRMFVWSWWP